MKSNTTGFKSSTEFSLYIENLKTEKAFETFTDTILWFHENQTDADIEDIAKLLNKRIRDFLEVEAQASGRIKDTSVKLF